MKTATLLLALAMLAACASPQSPGPIIDLEPESLYVEIDADAPISVTCTQGLPCGASAYGEASLSVEGAGHLRLGSVLIPGSVTASAAVSVERTEDGPVAGASAEVCFVDESKLIVALLGFGGPICFVAENE